MNGSQATKKMGGKVSNKKRDIKYPSQQALLLFFLLFSQLSIGKIRKTGKKKDILSVLDNKFEWWKLGKPRDNPI